MQAFADFVDGLLRGSLLVALALALGGVVWGLVVLRMTGRGASDPRLAVRCARLIVAGATALVVLQAASLGVRAAALLADLDAGSGTALLATLPFRGGIVRAVLALGLAAQALWLLDAPTAPGRWRVTAIWALAVAGSGAWLVHGAGRLEHRALLMTCTALHQVAAAVWTGGLVQLGAAWRLTRREPALAAAWPTVLGRFSQLALGAMVVLVATSSPLVWEYVGSWAGLVGTGYGSILATKLGLLAVVLVLAAANRRAIRRARAGGGEEPLRRIVPSFVEGETLLAVLILFTAATLSAQPPAVDVVAERASWPEVVRVFAPKWPTLRTPSVASMEVDTSDPLAVVGGERTAVAYSWSNYSHNVAGLFMLVMSLCALSGAGRGGGIARHWPLGFVALGVFVFLRTSANDQVWPFGARSFWATTFGDAEVLQHRLGALLVVSVGVVEWLAQLRPHSRLPYVFPMLAGLGGLLLLTHSHAAFEPKSYYLIQVTHTTMGGLAVIMACARWLELRFGPPTNRLFALTANVAMLLIALVLVFYQEANVVVPDA